MLACTMTDLELAGALATSRLAARGKEEGTADAASESARTGSKKRCGGGNMAGSRDPERFGERSEWCLSIVCTSLRAVATSSSLLFGSTAAGG
jgi:hypothetical protein